MHQSCFKERWTRSHFQRQHDRSCHNFVHRTVSGRCFPSVAVALAKELFWLKIQKSSWKHKSRLLLYVSSREAQLRPAGRFWAVMVFKVNQNVRNPVLSWHLTCFRFDSLNKYPFTSILGFVSTTSLKQQLTYSQLYYENAHVCVLFGSFSAHYLKWVQPCRTILFYGNYLLLLLWSLFLFHVHLL